MRILIVGGGIAGLALAALLRRHGRHPVVVERLPRYDDSDYAISLHPLGSCILHGLDIHEDFVARGVEVHCLEFRNTAGEILQRVATETITDKAGPMVTMPRSHFIELLRKACHGAEIRMGRSVKELRQDEKLVSVRYHEGGVEEFDLVVGCDGTSSGIRQLVIEQEENRVDTGWTAFTWRARRGLIPAGEIREFLGQGAFFGIYPARDRSMCLCGLPNLALRTGESEETWGVAIKTALGDLPTVDSSVRDAIDDASRFYCWPIADLQAPEWYRNRTALCGDSVAGFFPTAGIGASIALRSAAVLADELSRASAATVPRALYLYQERCRRIVQTMQDDSRTAARHLFPGPGEGELGANRVLDYYPAHRLFHQIVRSMKTPF